MHCPFVARDRLEAAVAEVARLQARVIELEQARDQAAFGVLQAALRGRGYALIGEEVAPFTPSPSVTPAWNSLDWRIYETWARNYKDTTGATDDEAAQEYKREHGNLAPSARLIV